ncbi:MAG: hypothetical protein V1754_08945, partial [Pseudomonadota bacterium]
MYAKKDDLSKRRYVPILVVLSAIVAMTIQLPWVIKPLNVFTDDGLVLEAVSRAHQGKGFTASTRPTQDLATPTFEYLYHWPPGPAGLLLGLKSVGLEIAFSYKLLYLLFLGVGTALWVLFASRCLSGFALVAVAAGLSVGVFGVLFIKLAQVLLWASCACLFLLFLRILDPNKRPSFLTLLGASLAAAVTIMCWYAAVAIVAGAVFTVFLLHKQSLAKRFVSATIVGSIGTIAFFLLWTINS